MAPEATGADHGRYDLLGKTELTFEPIELDGANLNDIAAAVADVLGLGQDELWVVDVRGRVLTVSASTRTPSRAGTTSFSGGWASFPASRSPGTRRCHRRACSAG
jgi:hypothetical protein